MIEDKRAGNVLPRLILASASPRRRNIINALGLKVQVSVSDIEEVFAGPPDQVVLTNAEKKARDVARKSPENFLVIGSDTVVFCRGKILGKPADEREALSTLSFLSGKMHEVYSAIAIIDNRKGKTVCDYSMTKVYFRELQDQEIGDYIKIDKPFDKAGAYGIQDRGALMVERIDGDYGTVMGFCPVLFGELMKRLGFDIWQFIA